MIERHPKILWIVILAGAGFCAGFFGPMLLVPEANQGPLLGIFITGPVGAVIGVVGYLLSKPLQLAARTQWIALGGLSAALVLVTLFFCLPGPQLLGHIVDVQIEKCQPVKDVTAEILSYWQKRIDAVTWASPRGQWREQMTRALSADKGVVLTVTVLEQVGIRRNRKPWNNGTLYSEKRRPDTAKHLYYEPAADGTCASFPAGTRMRNFDEQEAPESRRNEEWPPAAVSDFVPYPEIKQIPNELQGLGK